jgi:hypothetical protein
MLPFRRVRPLIACALLFCACGPSKPTAAGETLSVTIHIPARANPVPVPGVVSIDVEVAQSGADYRSVTVTETGGSSRTVTTWNGAPFEVVGSELHANGRRYGPLVPGTVVRVGVEGATVDGRELAPLR